MIEKASILPLGCKVLSILCFFIYYQLRNKILYQFYNIQVKFLSVGKIINKLIFFVYFLQI